MTSGDGGSATGKAGGGSERADQAKAKAGELTDQAKQRLEQLRQKAGPYLDQAKGKAGDLKEKAGPMANQAAGKASEFAGKAGGAAPGSVHTGTVGLARDLSVRVFGPG